MPAQLFKVLVVDDSSATRALLSAVVTQVIEDSGAEVEIIPAESGLEALRFLPGHSLDLIITDINMPDINGLELISFARKHPRHSGTPLLVVSTQTAAQDRDRALALGASDYCEKPIQPDALNSVIGNLLGLVDKAAP